MVARLKAMNTQTIQGDARDEVVLLCHGRLHTKTRGPLAAVDALIPYNTISIDARGMGESTGKTGYSNLSVSYPLRVLSVLDLRHCSKK